MDANLEKEMIKMITQKKCYEASFADLVKSFQKKLTRFNPMDNAFEVGKYFIDGKARKKAMQELLSDNIIQESWLEEYETKKGKIVKDFRGLYIFFHKKMPIYVGISKGVIGRILQHVKGHSHHTSSLAYRIALVRFELINGKRYNGARKHFDFKTEVAPAKAFLGKQRVAFIPVKSSEELYLFEIYCAMVLQCGLNAFDTH